MRKLVVVLFLLIVFGSCSVYLPQTVDIPLINKKNDLHVDMGWGSSFESANATVSYGLTDKFALQVYGAIGSANRYMYQGAFGYYKNLKDRGVMEIYIGSARGYGVVNASMFYPQSMKGDYQIYFAQINYGELGGEVSKWDFGAGLKIGVLHINGTSLVPGDTSEIEVPFVSNNLFVEPIFMARVGGEHLKFVGKLGFLISGSGYPFTPTLGIGLNYRL